MEWPSPPPAQKQSRFSGFFLPPEPTTVRNNLPMFPDFVAELTLTWNKPLSTRTTVPSYGQFLDLDGAEKAGLVNPPPGSISCPGPEPWCRLLHHAPIQALQVLRVPAGEDLPNTGKHGPCTELRHHASDISSHVSESSGHVCLLTVHCPLSLTRSGSLRITSSECPAVQRSPWEEGWLPRWWRRGTCG